MVFVVKTAFGNSIALSSAQQFSTKIKQKGKQVAPKQVHRNLVNWYCLTNSSLGQRKRSADWSSFLIAICINTLQYQREGQLGFHETSEGFLPSCLANLVLWSN